MPHFLFDSSLGNSLIALISWTEVSTDSAVVADGADGAGTEYRCERKRQEVDSSHWKPRMMDRKKSKYMTRDDKCIWKMSIGSKSKGCTGCKRRALFCSSVNQEESEE